MLVGDPREDLQQRLKKKDEHYTTPLEVPFITHWLHNMTHDQVLDMLKYLGMNNRPEDKVKVIFVPCYQDGKDGILNKHYYDLILGEDLSVYPPIMSLGDTLRWRAWLSRTDCYDRLAGLRTLGE